MESGDIFRYNFIAIALIAYINTPDRCDFNLPLAIWAFLLWNYRPQPQKHRILWVLLVSIFMDAAWLLAVSVGEWGQREHGNKLNGLTQVLSLVNLCYKLIATIYAIVALEKCDHFFSCHAFRKEVLYQQDPQ